MSQVFFVSDLDDAVSYHTPLQAAAMEDDMDNILSYGDGLEENSKPQGAILQWTYEGDAAQGFLITISEQEDLSDPSIYEADVQADELGIYSFPVKKPLSDAHVLLYHYGCGYRGCKQCAFLYQCG